MLTRNYQTNILTNNIDPPNTDSMMKINNWQLCIMLHGISIHRMQNTVWQSELISLLENLKFLWERHFWIPKDMCIQQKSKKMIEQFVETYHAGAQFIAFIFDIHEIYFRDFLPERSLRHYWYHLEWPDGNNAWKSSCAEASVVAVSYVLEMGCERYILK